MQLVPVRVMYFFKKIEVDLKIVKKQIIVQVDMKNDQKFASSLMLENHVLSADDCGQTMMLNDL